ncbi:MAG: hypothetical protein IT377_04490 [Polyangiaceae bacterium]|nr:hypothetical protein [Myxococcales bacterium]MCC6898206.1 hypothetical protein [Polyangiaceae bacterium]
MGNIYMLAGGNVDLARGASGARGALAVARAHRVADTARQQLAADESVGVP